MFQLPTATGETILGLNAHRGDCQRFIVRAKEKLATLMELESARKKTGDKERLTAALRPLNLELEPALVGVEARFCRRNGVIYLLHNRG